MIIGEKPVEETGETLYHVWWENHSIKESTWEPRSSFDTDVPIQEWLENKKFIVDDNHDANTHNDINAGEKEADASSGDPTCRSSKEDTFETDESEESSSEKDDSDSSI